MTNNEQVGVTVVETKRSRNLLPGLATMCIVIGVVALIGTNIHDRMQQDDAWAQGFRHGFSMFGGPVLGMWSDGSEPPSPDEDTYRSYHAGDFAGFGMAFACVLASLFSLVMLMVQIWGPDSG